MKDHNPSNRLWKSWLTNSNWQKKTLRFDAQAVAQGLKIKAEVYVQVKEVIVGVELCDKVSHNI